MAKSPCQSDLSKKYGETTHNFNFHGDLAKGKPGDENTNSHEYSARNDERSTYNIVINTANQSSCALSRELASALHWPVPRSYEFPKITNDQVAWVVILVA
jgi:hypothetical protein